MKTAAAAAISPRALRVLVYAAEESRRALLEGFLARSGHEVASALDDADIVLADGEFAGIEGVPVMTLGSAQANHAGSLDRDATPEQIDAALRAVAAGLVVRSATERGFAVMEENALSALLTPREMEVVNAMSRGLTNKMIAKRLEISLHTVKFHVESAFRKLGARTRAEAVAKALERLRRDKIEL